jgi:hypothetical protein
MHYFLFNNDIWVATDRNVRRLREQERDTFAFENVKTAHVCLVDIDVMLAIAPEERPEQKDLVLSREFSREHPGEYIIQDERVGTNLFQVMGARTEKVREIYRKLPGDKIVTFAPYAMAVRAFLNTQDIPDRKVVAFLDDWGGETLITFFEGVKFSTTRRFHDEKIERILPEIRRSAISFSKSLKSENGPYLVMTNNSDWAQRILALDPTQAVISLTVPFPAIEGLKTAQFPVKFELPEEVIKRTREKERCAKTPYFVAAGALILLGVFCVLFYWIGLSLQTAAYENVRGINVELEKKLVVLDQVVYRSAIQEPKGPNYGEVLYRVSHLLPPSYEMYALSFSSNGGHWQAQVDLALPSGEAFEEIPKSHLFGKDMTVNNVLVKDRPGKSIRIDL